MEVTTRRMNILLNSPSSISPIRGIPRNTAMVERGPGNKAKKFEVVGGDKHKIEVSAV